MGSVQQKKSMVVESLWLRRVQGGRGTGTGLMRAKRRQLSIVFFSSSPVRSFLSILFWAEVVSWVW
jgi:hypothetical protein